MYIALHHKVPSLDRDPQSATSNYIISIGSDVEDNMEENIPEGWIWMAWMRTFVLL
jgi:hypothetical protein